ncbi:hypothetical protein B8V09_03485 [Streptococcus agalactiae]|nr:hypothetical protein B8V09_03485 [Streptococcus agalactiae]
MKKSSSHKLGEAVSLKFQITQHIRDTVLLENIKNFLGCGQCYNNNLKGTVVTFSVESLSDLTEKIIPFFNNYPLKGIKLKNFEEFKKVANLMGSKAHLTESGLNKIREIKSEMNLRTDESF